MSTRIEALAQELDRAGYDAYFAASPVTMSYLTGFGEHGGERFLALAIRRTGEVRLICPALSATQAERAGIPDIRSWRDGEDPLEHVRELAEEWHLRAAMIAVDDEMPASMLIALQNVLPTALFRLGDPLMAKLMRVKDEQEIDAMRRAGRIIDEALEVVIPRLRPGLTELEVELMVSAAIRDAGGKPTFCIVASGPASAEPHHQNDHRMLEIGDVVILDAGCLWGNYHTDTTRTVAIGTADAEVREIYRVVWRAHRAALERIQVGIACEAVDRAAREVIEEAGYGTHFVHRTGHGIGRRVHEEPYIVRGNKLPIQAGFCFTVEPGIYLPGRFGVRLESSVVATMAGHESFHVDPPEELPVV